MSTTRPDMVAGPTRNPHDLTRTPVATAVHRVDRSPFRLLNPDELAAEGQRNGLRIDTSTKVFGHVMQFSATNP